MIIALKKEEREITRLPAWGLTTPRSLRVAARRFGFILIHSSMQDFFQVPRTHHHPHPSLLFDPRVPKISSGAYGTRY